MEMFETDLETTGTFGSSVTITGEFYSVFSGFSSGSSVNRTR